MLLGLDSTTKSIKAVLGSTNVSDVVFIALYADTTASSFIEGTSDGVVLGQTNTTIVAAPAASTRRIIRSITFYNGSAVNQSVFLKFNNNETERCIIQFTLGPYQSWSSDDDGDAGNFNLINGTTPVQSGTSGSVLFNNNGTLGELARTGTSTIVSSISPTIATPSITTSLSTSSTSFDLLNTTATTVNFAGAATTLNVGGAANSTVQIGSGSASIVNIGGGSTAAELRLLEPSGSGTNYTAFKAQAQAANVTYTLPAADGSANQVLTTNGTGGLSWAAGGGGGSGLGYKNLLINGGMAIDQRERGSARTLVDAKYGLDRWYVLTEHASGCSVEQQTYQSHTRPFNLRLTQNQSTPSRMGIAQIIEGVNCTHLRGQKVTLSFDFAFSTAADLRYAILEWTGSQDTFTDSTRDVVNSWASANYTGGNFFKSTNLTINAVGTMQTVTGNTWTTATALTSATLGSTFTNLIVFIWTEDSENNGFTMSVSNVQLEPGTSATDFDRRGYTQELQLCQRYLPMYRHSGLSVNEFLGLGFINGGSSGFLFLPLFVTPRTVSTSVTIANNVGTDELRFVGATSGAPYVTTIDSGITNGVTVSGASFAMQVNFVAGQTIQPAYVYVQGYDKTGARDLFIRADGLEL
jgi:hypothetical protein